MTHQFDEVAAYTRSSGKRVAFEMAYFNAARELGRLGWRASAGATTLVRRRDVALSLDAAQDDVLFLKEGASHDTSYPDARSLMNTSPRLPILLPTRWYDSKDNFDPDKADVIRFAVSVVLGLDGECRVTSEDMLAAFVDSFRR